MRNLEIFSKSFDVKIAAKLKKKLLNSIILLRYLDNGIIYVQKIILNVEDQMTLFNALNIIEVLFVIMFDQM